MSRPSGNLPSAHVGEASAPLAASHSRLGHDQPAAQQRPRPAERALGTRSPALQLAFDSFREPVPAGHSETRCGQRHLVYLCRDYAVDVRLLRGRHRPSVLRGELLSRGGGPVAEIPTFLLAGDRIAGDDRTGRLGEFRLETRDEVDLRLCLLLDAERCIDLPIAGSPAPAPATPG